MVVHMPLWPRLEHEIRAALLAKDDVTVVDAPPQHEWQHLYEPFALRGECKCVGNASPGKLPLDYACTELIVNLLRQLWHRNLKPEHTIPVVASSLGIDEGATYFVYEGYTMCIYVVGIDNVDETNPALAVATLAICVSVDPELL